MGERQFFRSRQRILIAVSGGLDSMVLLALMNELARREGWRLTVAHLNHRLRGKSSDADARFVRRAAKELGWPAAISVANVTEIARRKKLSVEMASRNARHEFLARTATRLRIRTVALAHHADDQVELFFLRLFRGSGSQGLPGMQWRNPSPVNPRIELVRPLLGQTRAILAKYAAEKGVRFREDASNTALDIQRNRIRHELLPLLRQRYQPALNSVIARVLEITQAEAEVVTEAARRHLSLLPGIESRAHVASIDLASYPSPLPSPQGRGRSIRNAFAKARTWKARTDTKHGSKKLSLESIEFGNLPVAVQRRSLQLQLFGLGISPDFDLIEQLRLKEARPVTVSLDKLGSSTRPGNQLFLSRDSDGLVRVEESKPATFLGNSTVLDLGSATGKAIFDGIRVFWEQRVCKDHKVPKKAVNCEWFDADRVGSKILLRHWQAGDRFQPIGMTSSVKLQDFFTNQQIPRQRRHEIVLAVSADNEVFWVEGMRISERFKLTNATNRRLQWRWQKL